MAIKFEYENVAKDVSTLVAYARIYNVNYFNNAYALIDVHVFLSTIAKKYEVVKSFEVKKIIMKLKNPEEPESPENLKEPVINPAWTELHSGNIIVKAYEYLMQQTDFFKNPVLL
jgi:hypothetical protein